MKIVNLIVIIFQMFYTIPFNEASTRELLLIDKEQELISSKLPQESEIIQIDNKNYIRAQLDGKGEEEFIVAFKNARIKNAVFLLVISNDNAGGSSFRLKGDGCAVDRLEVVDVNGDGKDDILLGTKIGSSLNRLHVFSFNNNRYFKEFSYSYNKFEIINERNRLKNPAFAFWVKNPGGCYDIEVVRWTGYELVDAPELYKNYFKKVVDYYKQLSIEQSENPYVWFSLADAQIKTGEKEEALKSIAKGVALNKEMPTKQQFDELKRKIR